MSNDRTARWTARQWLALTLFAAAALLGNILAPRMFTGFNYLFGSVGVMIVLRFFGMAPALVTAVLAAAWCKQLFGHYYPVFWLGLEPLFVWLWLKRRPHDSLVLADTIYWLFIGSPLILFFFLSVLNVTPLGTVAAALMYTTIGIANSLLATIITDQSCIQRLIWPERGCAQLTIAQLLFQVLMLAIIVPAILVLALSGRMRETAITEKMIDQLEIKVRQVGYEVRQKVFKGSYPPVFGPVERETLNTDLITGVLKEIQQKQPLELHLLANRGELLASTSQAISAESNYDPLALGIISPTDRNNIFRRIPSDKQAIPLWQRAGKTVFIRLYPIPNTPVYAVAEMQFAPFQAQILQGHRNALAALLLYLAFGSILAMVVSRRIAQPLSLLSSTTTHLPAKLITEDLDWPSSNITEIAQLVSNAQEMSHILSHQFREIAQINSDLEERVALRTRELTTANIELRTEIEQRVIAQRERDNLLRELEAKNKELESIIYVASHDLRSPLVNVQGFSRKLAKSCTTLGSLADQLTGPEQAKQELQRLLKEGMPRSLDFITGSVEKMDGLLSGLLRLSRLGRAAITIENLDMNQLMGKITDSVTFQLEGAGAKISRDLLLPCQGDAVQVSQVFTNLLDNAIKYRAPERTLEIRITSTTTAEGVDYCVADNGIGIHPDYQEQVWEVFHRINPRDIPGEGLGLTVSRRILDRLNGTIRLESQEGVGSRFYVRLPAARY